MSENNYQINLTKSSKMSWKTTEGAKCPQNAPKMGALNQDHGANSEGAPKMPPECPQNGGKMGAHPENRERSGGGAQKFAASGGAVSRTSLILLLP